MSRTRDRITVGKAHAFDMGYTADELKTAWDTVKKTNVLVQHLENNGVTPLSLPPDLMDDLMKKYKKYERNHARRTDVATVTVPGVWAPCRNC